MVWAELVNLGAEALNTMGALEAGDLVMAVAVVAAVVIVYKKITKNNNKE